MQHAAEGVEEAAVEPGPRGCREGGAVGIGRVVSFDRRRDEALQEMRRINTGNGYQASRRQARMSRRGESRSWRCHESYAGGKASSLSLGRDMGLLMLQGPARWTDEGCARAERCRRQAL